MPVEIYKDLEKIKFCGIDINAPKRKEYFLDLVYGANWKIPDMNFKRYQMKNLSYEDK